MTIQEAIKSGKPFARPKYYEREEKFLIKDDMLYFIWLDYSETPPKWGVNNPEYAGLEMLNIEDILADDWEVVE